MNDTQHSATAISALVLAFLFPVYWITEFWDVAKHGGEAIYRNVSTLNPWDFLFLLTGVLSVIVYLGFRRFLNQRFGVHQVDIPLLLLAVVTGVFTIGTFSMDAFMHFFGDQLFLAWHTNTINGVTITMLISTVVFGALDILVAVILLSQASKLSSGLVAFGILTLIQGVTEFTVVFAFSVVAVYPVALIVLAIVIIQKPQELEVI